MLSAAIALGQDGTINYDEMDRLSADFKPKLLISGARCPGTPSALRVCPAHTHTVHTDTVQDACSK